MNDTKASSADAAQAFAGPGPDARFRERLAEGVLTIQRCRACHSAIFYPRLVCPSCGSLDLEQIESAGAGSVYSTSVVRRKPESGGDYNIAIVELDEGPRMMSQVLDVAPTDVAIGMKVKATIEEVDGAPAVFFRPMERG